MSRLVAIHQPNFFPWLGFFDKIRRADSFVFLDDVSYPRSGSGSMGSWSNRVRLNIQSEARWVTCPIKRMPLGSLIKDAEIDDTQPWRTKLIKTLEANYRRAPNFRSAMDVLSPLVTYREHNLADYNIHVIKTLADHLGLSCTFVRQSELPHHGEATELLISILQCAGGTAYLAGGGAAGYQDDALFAHAGLDLVYQNFKPSSYGDARNFIAGLSVIDYLMHDGRPLGEATTHG